ncbi:MAG: tRNA lysidine(34) synthetase TilS [Gemmataceae bacterium]
MVEPTHEQPPTDLPRLAQTLHDFFRAHGICGRVLVAVSGGPDSLAMLYALWRWPAPGMTFLAAHLNHRLRGSESDADEEFVRAFCASRDILCVTERIAVAEQTRRDIANLEATARRLRYQWLTRVARAHQATCVLTAHTADDQAETVLHHLLRGTGLRGLRGIAPRWQHPSGVAVCRPFLSVRRQEIAHFVRTYALQPRLDTSNLDLSLMRNRIRHCLLPVLEREYRPQVVSLLCRLAEQARQWQSFIAAEARARLSALVVYRAADRLTLRADLLRELPAVLGREVLRLAWDEQDWPLGAMSARHWQNLFDLASRERGCLVLPGTVRATRTDRLLVLRRQSERD